MYIRLCAVFQVVGRRGTGERPREPGSLGKVNGEKRRNEGHLECGTVMPYGTDRTEIRTASTALTTRWFLILLVRLFILFLFLSLSFSSLFNSTPYSFRVSIRAYE